MSLILLFKLKEKKKKKKENKEYDYFKNQGYLSRLFKLKTFKKVDKFLKEAQYPIKTNHYVLINFFALFIFILTATTDGFMEGVSMLVYILAPINFLIYRKFAEARNQLRISLCDVQEIFYFQGQIGTPIDVIFANVSRIAKEPLKKSFEETTTIYNLTKNIDEALEPLNSYDLMDLKALCISVKQREETGYSEENHKAQLTMMKRNRRLRKRSERESKRARLITSAILLFLCCSAIVTIPMMKNVLNSINLLLR